MAIVEVLHRTGDQPRAMGKRFPLHTRADLGKGHVGGIAGNDAKAAPCQIEGVAAVSASDLKDRIISG